MTAETAKASKPGTLEALQSANSRPSAFRTFSVFMLVCGLLSLAAPWTGAKIASLYEFALQPNPYLVPRQGVFLYVIAPVITLASLSLLLAPGLFVASTLGSKPGFAAWILKGFALSFLLVTLIVHLIEGVSGGPLTGVSFALVVIGLAISTWMFASVRGGKEALEQIPWRDHAYEIIAMAVLPLLFLISFSPKFYWENFNGDGAHAFMSTILVIQQFNPFWPADAGAVAGDPGFTTVLTGFAAAWLVRLFGENEYAMRALLLLNLPLMLCGLMALVRHGRSEMDKLRPVCFIAAALYLFGFVFAYNTTYDPYVSDIALPAVRETLLMVCFLSFLYFFLSDNRLFTIVFGVFTYLTVPSGLPLLVFWMAAVVLVWRPVPWHSVLLTAGIVAGCMMAGAAMPIILGALGQPVPGGEFNADGLFQRLRYVAFLDIERFGYWMVPVGILPAVSLLFLWRQDRIAKAITLLTVFYFLLFYFQGYRILLHHFVPAIILPLVVLWRYDELGAAKIKRYVGPVLGGALGASLVISLPSSFTVHTFARTVGEHLQVPARQASRLENMQALAAAHELIDVIYPPSYDAAASDHLYLATPLPLYHYALLDKPSGQAIAYDMTLGSTRGGSSVAQSDGYALYIRDQTLYERHRSTKVPSSAQNALYYAPRAVLYQGAANGKRRLVIDLVAVVKQIFPRPAASPDGPEEVEDPS